MKPARRRQVIEHVQALWRVSVRRACETFMAARSTFYYHPRRDEQAALWKRIKEIAETRIRYGYRRIHVLLVREGWRVNAKRVYRLYKEEGLQLRRKTPKRRVSAKRRESPMEALAPNEIWAMDFMSDQLVDGRRIRILTIVDAFTRVSPAVDVRHSYKGSDVVETLEQGDQGIRYAQRDPSGQRPRVYQQGFGSLGRYERGCSGVFKAGQTNGERLHRKLQRQAQGGMPQRVLVFEPKRCKV